MKKHIILLFIFCLLSAASLFSQEQLKFQHLSENNGLSSKETFWIAKDKKGYMWFATSNGISRYNGYEFKNYTYYDMPGEKLDLGFIFSIFIDSKDNIWLASSQGLFKLDQESGHFFRFKHLPGRAKCISASLIQRIAEDKNGAIYASTMEGVDRIDPVSGTVQSILKPDASFRSPSHMVMGVSMLLESDELLWLGTPNGIIKFNPQTGGKSVYRIIESDHPILINKIRNIFKDSQGQYWVGTEDGLFLFDPVNGSFEKYDLEFDKVPSLKENNIVISMVEEAPGVFWIGTVSNGFKKLYAKERKVVTYQYDPLQEDGINSNSVRYVFKDDVGSLWLATGQGINKVDLLQKKFYNFYTGLEHNLNNKKLHILAFHEYSKGRILLGTNDGLKLFDLNKRQELQCPLPKEISKLPVNSIAEAHNQVLYFATSINGIFTYNPKDSSIKNYNNTPGDYSSIMSKEIWTVYTGRDGTIWVGTDLGLSSFNFKTEKFVNYKHDFNDPESIGYGGIGPILEDKEGNIWAGSMEGGLSLLNKKTGKFKRFIHDKNNPHSIVNNGLIVIHEDKKGRIWVGTKDGLDLFDKTNEKFYHFRNNKSKEYYRICGLLEDDKGNFWMSTMNSITKFNPKTNVFKNYDKYDGILGTYSSGDFMKTSKKEFLFGSNEGFTAFHPDSLKENTIPPPITLTDFEIFNRSVSTLEDSRFYKDIGLIKEINLNHNESFFGIKFSALNYLIPEKNQYAFMLSGFEKDWNYIGNRRQAYYTNIPPGNYVFRVKACNNDGIWNEQDYSLRINIHPAYWQTWWFKLLIILSFVSVAYLYYKSRVSNMKKINSLLEDTVEKRTIELSLANQHEKENRILAEIARAEALKAKEEAEFLKIEADRANSAKSLFLANMSHEIRTPMNGIIGMTEILTTTSLSTEQKDFVRTIKNSGETLLEIINNILDFSKIESGKMDLDIHSFNVEQCIEGVLDIFGVKAGEKGIDLIYLVDHNVPPNIIGDSLKIKQVLTNLVGNAIKFTHKGEIFIDVARNDKGSQDDHELELAFTVKDTGIGIPKGNQKKLFQSFSQVDASTTRKYGGTGLGLAISSKLVQLMGGTIGLESEEGVGTKFFFFLKIKTGLNVPTKYSAFPYTDVKGKKVLVVDDNLTNRNILKLQFESWQIVPIMAASGMEAIEILEKEKDINLVVTDMQMPHMDGEDLCKKIRLSSQYKSIPIILLTSMGNYSNLKNEKELFSTILIKPVKQRLLFKAVIHELTISEKKPIVETNEKEGLINLAQKYPASILVAEDNPTNQKLAKYILNKLGYNPDFAGNGKEALQALECKKYDLVLMDVQMPEMDGLEATRFIRSDKRMQEQPIVIALTANAMQEDKEMCLKAGMDDYLSKPFKIDDLVKIIEKNFK